MNRDLQDEQENKASVSGEKERKVWSLGWGKEFGVAGMRRAKVPEAGTLRTLRVRSILCSVAELAVWECQEDWGQA